MPKRKVNGAEIHYEEQGNGPETIFFAHGLLLSGLMYEAQVRALKDRYRCITMDFRGQGGSEVTAAGYDMDTLSEDAAGLIEALGSAPCHFVGLSMGGFIGMRLAIRHPHLLRSLTLLDTSADPEPAENLTHYRMLNFIARWLGFRLVIGQVMPILFARKFLSDPSRAEQRKIWRQRLLDNDRIGTTRAVRGVIQRDGVYDQIARIELPTLILVGEMDVATVPAKSERIQQQIRGSKMARIPNAGHSTPIEEPEAVTEQLVSFLKELN